jgi:hypothetical protein
VLFLAMSLIQWWTIFFFIFCSLNAFVFWLLMRNTIASVSFLKDTVIIERLFGKKETVEYRDLQKFAIKIEGFNNKTISTIHYLSPKGKVKTVDFRTHNLDHQQFKSELIRLKHVA